MTKGESFFNKNKKIIIISVLLILLIALAIILFGGKKQSLTVDSADTRTQTEAKLMRILSEIDGVGKSEVMVTEGPNGVEGVIIVCEGANDLMTRNDVINAVKVALKIEKNNIAVYAMN